MTQNSSTASVERNILPTSVTQAGIIARYEILNYFRSRRFLILLVVDLLISGLLSFLVAYYGIATFAGSPASTLAFYGFWWTAVSSLIIVFCAVFFGGDAISGEFQNKTGYFLVGNPIRRSSIYVGKWIAALIASLIIIGIFTAIMLANGFYYVGSSIPTQFGEAFVFTIIYLISALGFTFFFSSLFKSSAFSILVTVILLLFGFSLIDTLVTNIAHIEPWFSLTYGSGIISDVFTVPYPPHTTPLTGGFGGGGGRGPPSGLIAYVPTIPEGLATMGIYFVIMAVLGLVLFERKEFN
jgi:ABC-2 type transport system permease protein